jgi:hypothetical protein
MAIITGPLLRFSIPNHFPVKHAAPRPPLPSQNLSNCEPWFVVRCSGHDLRSRCARRSSSPELAIMTCGPWTVDREPVQLANFFSIPGSRNLSRSCSRTRHRSKIARLSGYAIYRMPGLIVFASNQPLTENRGPWPAGLGPHASDRVKTCHEPRRIGADR